MLVQLLEVAGDGVGVVFVVSQEKVDAAQRMTHAPDGVEARCENKTDAASGDLSIGEPGGANQRPKPDVVRLVEHLQAVAREHAILSAQRGDVGNCRQRDKIEHAVDGVLVPAALADQRQRQLERDADGGQISVG